MASHSPEPGTSAVQGALLDYYGAPGKYQLSLRQPAILFSSIREVLQFAARPPEGAGEPSDVRDAANFFIRAAMLFPGADHYAVFGLESRTEPVELKERYRLLMRLTHPDFAGGQWPRDAAIRVNQAYEVLSSPVLRQAYDEQLGASAKPPRAAARPLRAAPEPKFSAEREHHRRTVLRRVALAAATAGFLVAGLLVFAPDSESRRLVQRKAAPPVRPQAASMPPAVPAPAPTPIEQAAVAPMPEVAPASPAPTVSAWVQPATASQPAPARLVPPPLPLAPQPALQPALQPAQAAAPLTAPAAAPMLVPAPPPPRPVLAVDAAPPPAVATLAPQPATERSAAPAGPRAVAASAQRPAAASFPPPPALVDVQPLLSQVFEALESGNGGRLLALLEPGARGPAAQALTQHYNELVGGARPVHVAHGEFRSEARESLLQVTTIVRLHAGEPTIGSLGQRFVIKAEFASRGGKAHLVGLSGAND